MVQERKDKDRDSVDPKVIFPTDAKNISFHEARLFSLLNTIQSERRRAARQHKGLPVFYAFFGGYLMQFTARLEEQAKADGVFYQPAYNGLQTVVRGGGHFQKIFRNEIGHTTKKSEGMNYIREYVRSCRLSGAARTYIDNFLNQQADAIEAQATLWRRLREEKFLSQWRDGEFTYRHSLFSSPEAITAFAENFNRDCPKMFRMDQRREIRAAMQQMTARLLKHEQQLWAQEAQPQSQLDTKHQDAETARRRAFEERAREAALQRIREGQAAQERIKHEQERQRRWQATAQPYALKNEAAEIVNNLSHFATTTATQAPQAKVLVAGVETAREALDLRRLGIKELGDVLLSPANLLSTARALETDNPLRQFTPANGTGLTAHAAMLHKLDTVYPDARQAMERLLQSRSGIVFLATLVRGEGRCKEYAHFLRDSTRKLEQLNAAVTRLEPTVRGFSPQDLEQLKEDAEVKNFLSVRQERDALRARIKAVQTDFAAEVRQTFRNGSHTRILADLPIIAGTPAAESASALPQAWVDAMNGEFHPEVSPQGNKHVLICSNDFNYKQFDIKRNVGDGAFLQNLGILRAAVDKHRVNMGLLQQLGDPKGYEAYGITIPNEPMEDQQTRALEKAKAQFEARRFEQQSMLDTARQAGITVETAGSNGHASPITISHKNFGTITSSGYLTADEFTAIEGWIEQLQRQRNLPMAAPLEAEVPVALSRAVPWQPREEETLLIFDANVLNHLSALRGNNGHSWLDLIKCTARLPNVKVIIPAVIADWELQGKIPRYDEYGNRTGFEQVDKRFQNSTHFLSHIAAPVEKFLQSASRACIVDGPRGKEVLIEENANKNIIIMDAEGDKELYARIHDIKHGPPQDEDRRMYTEVYHQGEGEKAINRVIAQLPFKQPVMIVSDDMRYFNEKVDDPQNGHVKAPATSGSGMPVSQASIGSYLDAEIQARADTLRGHLREAQMPNLKALGKKINDYWTALDPEQSHYFFRHNRLGEFVEPQQAAVQNIQEVIAHGVALSQANGHGNGKGNGTNNGKWSSEALRADVQQRPITPVDVNNRSGNDTLPAFS